MESQASLFLQKARDDLIAVWKLAPDPEVADSVIGFHAQQAAEKFLKAVLFARGVLPPRTHNLTALLNLLADSGEPLVVDADQLAALTPFALEYCNAEDLPEDAGPLDRPAFCELAAALGSWAESTVRAADR